MGNQLSVDYIIPCAVVPELDNCVANLELMPLRMNESKNAKIGSRQKAWRSNCVRRDCFPQSATMRCSDDGLAARILALRQQEKRCNILVRQLTNTRERSWLIIRAIILNEHIAFEITH